MSGLARVAWEGFSDFLSGGKYVGLLAAACIFLWTCRERTGQRALRVYGVCMTVLCICPVTAAFLMKYQTNYYAYEWIWSLVPMTALTAWAGVLFLREVGREESRFRRPGAVVLLCVLVVLCGNLTGRGWSDGANCRPFVKAALLEITQNGKNKTVCLWAPRIIMEHARAVDGDVELIYGRDLWESALHAYSYDGYGPEEARLYAWMNEAEEQCRGQAQSEGGQPLVDYEELSECLALAQELGVTHILLPGLLDGEALRERLPGSGYVAAARIDSPGDRSEEGYYLLERR